jgi:hypothetical protein
MWRTRARRGEFLAAARWCARVGYPGSKSHPATRWRSSAAAARRGAVFSFELDGTRAQGDAFIEALKLFSTWPTSATPLAGHPPGQHHALRMDDAALAAAGIGAGHDPPVDRPGRPADLIDDLKRGAEGRAEVREARNEPRSYAYTGGKPFDAALPCVVFVHGALHDHSVFTLLARSFAHAGFGVLAVDLPAPRAQRRGRLLSRSPRPPRSCWQCSTPAACSAPPGSGTAWAR